MWRFLLITSFLAGFVWSSTVEVRIDEGELNKIFYRFWTPEMGKDSYVDIKTHDVGEIGKMLLDCSFSTKVETKIVIHGFSGSADNVWEKKNFASAYHDAGIEVNLIVIDWAVTAAVPNYIHAGESTAEVGEWIALHLGRALLEIGTDLDKIHLIGHSLGCHVAGNFGRNMVSKVGRLTALDPAKPGFDIPFWSEKTLKKTDASFVDVIHTNSGDMIEGCLSFIENVGHVDFWPNLMEETGPIETMLSQHNQHQPGCVEQPIFGLNDLIKEVMKGMCSHGRAWSFYLESIRSRFAFESRPCLTWEPIYDYFHIIGRKCIEAASDEFTLYLGENLDIERATKILGEDTRYFLTTSDGSDGKFSKDEFEL